MDDNEDIRPFLWMIPEMTYANHIVTHIPPPPLNNYIVRLWYMDMRVSYHQERILPTATVELIINFGSPFRLYDRHDEAHSKLLTESWLTGLHSTYFLNEAGTESHMIGVQFKPGGLAPFFRLPASELHNQIVSLDTLWGRFADEIRERLYAAQTIAARFALLETLLLARLNEPPHNLNAIQAAVAEIARQQGSLSIRSLSDQIGMSQKHLITLFKRIVGVSPKTLARIYRFQQVLHIIDPSKPVDWTMIAQAASYYDQSHFNDEFMGFTGLRPTDYVRLRRETHGNDLAQGEDMHFVPIG